MGMDRLTVLALVALDERTVVLPYVASLSGRPRHVSRSSSDMPTRLVFARSAISVFSKAQLREPMARPNASTTRTPDFVEKPISRPAHEVARQCGTHQRARRADSRRSKLR